jgi:hypothetical protein
MYFGPQNSKAIDAMIGVGSANWPDILEAQSFNSEYGLYISAPPGTSQGYPSHLGGFYIASNGLHKFYNVTSKEELEPSYEGALPPFKVSVNPTEENLFDFTVKNTQIEVWCKDFSATYDPQGAAYQLTNNTVGGLVIHGLSPKIFNKIFQIDYDKVSDLNVGITLSAVWDSIDRIFKADPTFPLEGVTVLENPEDPNLLDITISGFDLVKFAPDGSTPVDGGFLSVDAYNELIVKDTTGEFKDLLTLLTTGFVKLANSKKFNTGFALQDLIHEVVNISDDTYMYVMQKGCTEKQTQITISDISYDKYRYDQVFDYVKVNDFNTPVKPTSGSKDYLAMYVENPGQQLEVRLFAKASLTNPSLSGDDDYYKNVTEDYNTQYVSFAHPRDLDDDDSTVPLENDALFRRVWFVFEGKLRHVLTLEECIEQEDGDEVRGTAFYNANITAMPAIVAPGNTMFNSVTFSVKEEVYPGELTNGGTFTGSLDEYGVDTYGSNIYFPSVISDDDFSFVEVRVIKKFGDEADDLSNGFWTKTRSIDPFDMDVYEGEISQQSFTIEGDRYADLVMNMNLIERRTGGVYRNEYYNIIKDGLTEVLKPEYDDAYVIMEPTGQDLFAQQLGTARKAQEFATVISPFICPSSAINSGLVSPIGAQKIIVPARARGVSRFMGEFEVYDPITKKKYWAQPIGDVGLMLARIIDKKLGVWAPAWTNTGDVGGQLMRSVLRSRYNFDDSSLDDKLKVTYILDQKGINPIAFTDDGMMILSSKTTEDPYNLSQWCFLEGQMGFDLCKRQIRDSVMRLQIKKPLTDYYFSLRQQQVESIIGQRTSGSNPLWYSATCDVKGVNNEQTKRQRDFRIKVTCKPTIFAESVSLELHVEV